jgi:hypothetical protein
MKILLRTTYPIVAVLLLGACERASAPLQASGGVPVPHTLPPQTAHLAETADRLRAEYESGARPFPSMSADPRDAVSPETLRMMMATAERLSEQYAADAR